MNDAEREILIRQNIEAEQRMLERICRATGVKLPRLQFAGELEGEKRQRLVEIANGLVENEPNSFVRGCIYSLFRRGIPPDRLDSVLQWHARETDEESLQILDGVLTLDSNPVLRARIVGYLKTVPEKLQVDGILFLARTAQSEPELLATLREHFDNRRFDHESLAVVGNQHENLYNRIAKAPPFGTERLRGRHCASILTDQLPHQEYAFRRAELAPHYGRVVYRTSVQPIRIDEEVEKIAHQHGIGRTARRRVGGSAGVEPGCAVPILIETGAGGSVVAVVLIAEAEEERRRHHHGRRPIAPSGQPISHELAVVEVQPPEAWNLFPKRLLPPDHPIRCARPEQDA